MRSSVSRDLSCVLVLLKIRHYDGQSPGLRAQAGSPPAVYDTEEGIGLLFLLKDVLMANGSA